MVCMISSVVHCTKCCDIIWGKLSQALVKFINTVNYNTECFKSQHTKNIKPFLANKFVAFKKYI